jgi:DNA-binding response OmpR family regulator
MRKRVLIADDDPAILRALARRCRRLGLRVEAAPDGYAAGLSLFLTDDRSELPTLIILDVEMPGEDGLSLCEELRRDDVYASVPIIVLTGRGDRGTVRRCEELRVRHLLKSEMVWDALESLISQLVDVDAVASASSSPTPTALPA